MDLPTFAETEGADIPLPEEVEDVALTIGRGLAVRLSMEGRMFYVPRLPKATHPLSLVVGHAAARAMEIRHRHCLLALPQCDELIAAWKAFEAGS